MEILANLVDLIDRQGQGTRSDGRRACQHQRRSQALVGDGHVPGQAVAQLANRIGRATRAQKDDIRAVDQSGDVCIVGAERCAPLACGDDGDLGQMILQTLLQKIADASRHLG